METALEEMHISLGDGHTWASAAPSTFPYTVSVKLRHVRKHLGLQVLIQLF